MVTVPLSACPVAFLLIPEVELPAANASVFDMIPFTNDTWRGWCGLAPLATNTATDEQSSDGQTEDEVARWLTMTTEGYRSLRTKAGWQDPTQLRCLLEFMAELRRRALKDRKGCLARITQIPNHKVFAKMMLAMLNRRGGVIDEIEKLLEQTRYSVKHVWQDHYHANLAKPEQKRLALDKFDISAFGDTSRVSSVVCKRLFGDKSVTWATKSPLPEYSMVVDAFLRRAWERFSRRMLKEVSKAVRDKDSYVAAFERANKDPSVTTLNLVTKKLKSWKNMAELTGEVDQTEYKQHEADLKKLWLDLGFAQGENGDVVKTGKRTKACNPLMTDAQMEGAYHNYLEAYSRSADDSADDLFEMFKEGLGSDEGEECNIVEHDSEDLGVAKYADSPDSELDRLLGLVDSLFPFGETGKDKDPKKPKMVPRWHQKVLVAVALERIFTLNKDEPPVPTFLCDDVGMGKTGMMTGVISELAHTIECQSRKEPLPPLLTGKCRTLKKLKSGRLYLAGREQFPRLPHLIVTQRTLCGQVKAEILKYTDPGAFRVFIYSRDMDREAFFCVGSPWDTFVTKSLNPHRTIVIAETPTLMAETRETMRIPPAGAQGKIEFFRGDPPEVVIADPTLTIFTKSFLSVSFDEAHMLRNQGSAYYAALRLAHNSVVRMACTASPVFTSPTVSVSPTSIQTMSQHLSLLAAQTIQDLSAQGRLLLYEPMIGEKGVELGLQAETLTKQAEKHWRDNEDDLMKLANPAGAQPLAPQSQPGTSGNAKNTALVERATEQEKRGFRNAYTSRAPIAMFRKKLLPIIVRRTGRSLTAAKEPVLQLKPYVESKVWTIPTESEQEILDRLAEQLVNNDEIGNVKKINFLLDYKNATFHSELLAGDKEKKKDDKKKDDKKVQFYESWTTENIDERASSKIRQVCSLVAHYQHADAQPLFFLRDGSRDYTREAANQCLPARKPRKIVIFVMYEIHRTILKLALELKGFECLEYDGKMSLKAREQSLKLFEEQDDVRILLISNVGTTGLNMTMASVIIFVSILWSYQENQQAIGRLWRFGQLEDVIAYTVVCPGTADELISGLAYSKLVMGEWFLGGSSANKIFDYVDSESEDEAPLLDEKEEAKVAKLSKTKVRPRNRKNAQNDEASPSQTAEATQVRVVKPSPGSSGSSRKRKAPEEVDSIQQSTSGPGDRGTKAAQQGSGSKKPKSSKGGGDDTELAGAQVETQKPKPKPRPKPVERMVATGSSVETSPAVARQSTAERVASTRSPAISTACSISALGEPPKASDLPMASLRLTGDPKGKGKEADEPALVPDASADMDWTAVAVAQASSTRPAPHATSDVNVDEDWSEVFDITAASTEERWVPDPMVDDDVVPMAMHGAEEASAPSVKPPVQVAASRQSSESRAKSCRPSKPAPPPFSKEIKHSETLVSSASQPVRSTSANSSTKRFAPPARGSASASSSQPNPVKPPSTAPARRPGQFKPKKQPEPLPSAQASTMRRKQAAVEKTDGLFQRGEKTPRSPSRGRRSAPGARDMSSSPPLEGSRRR